MSFSSVARPPDDPTDVYNRRVFVWTSTTIVMFLSVASYALRIWARKKSNQYLEWDDWLMGLGLIFSLEPGICQYVLLANGLGHHIWNVPTDQQYNFSRTSFALQRANQPSLVCIKMSILLFYLRLFPNPKFRYAAYANMAYTIMWGVASFFVNLTVCTPIAYFYDHTIPGGSCKNQAISGSINGGLSLLGDIAILCLPLPMIWRLQINKRRRIALMGIFLLGSLVCVSSGIRIVYLVNFLVTDSTYTQVYASTWTYLEMGIAVISGNLPLLRPLFERFFRNKGASRDYISKRSHPSNLHSHDGTTSHPRNHNEIDLDGFERISDDAISERPLHYRGNDLELGDLGILVTKDLTVVTHRVEDEKSVESRTSDW